MPGVPWTPRCDALLDQSLGHGACKCLPRRAAHTYKSNNDIHAGAANGARTKNKHTIAATHFAAAIASTAACRSTPNFAPTRALGALRCALVAACIPRALATFAASCAASWAAPPPGNCSADALVPPGASGILLEESVVVHCNGDGKAVAARRYPRHAQVLYIRGSCGAARIMRSRCADAPQPLLMPARIRVCAQAPASAGTLPPGAAL